MGESSGISILIQAYGRAAMGSQDSEMGTKDETQFDDPLNE
jgi:hypothetical protein